jgi:hypothetical protein
MTEPLLRAYGAKVAAFERAAHSLLARHETSSSRVIELSQTYEDVAALNVRQGDLLKQALRCAEHGLYRAAHVMAWAAFMDFLEEKLSSDGLLKLRAERPKWQGADIHEIAEYVPERQLVEVTKPLGLCTKNGMNALISLLQRRNECAHPSAYYPGLNETLGYISELMKRLDSIAGKRL